MCIICLVSTPVLQVAGVGALNKFLLHTSVHHSSTKLPTFLQHSLCNCLVLWLCRCRCLASKGPTRFTDPTAVVLYLDQWKLSQGNDSFLSFNQPLCLYCVQIIVSYSAFPAWYRQDIRGMEPANCKCSNQGRNLVVCIDGTSNQFGTKVRICTL